MTDPIHAHGSLGGRTVRHLDAAGLLFTETRHRPLLTLPRHANDRATVIAVLNGDYVETLASRTRRFEPGAFILRPPGEVHSNRIGPRGARCLLIEFTPARFEGIDGCAELFRAPFTIDPGLTSSIAVRATGELAAPDAATPLALESLVFDLLAQIVRRSSPTTPRLEPSWIPRVLGMLEHHDGAPTPTLRAIAHLVGRHPVYVARAFRAHRGCSVGEYARRRRVAWACDRLIADDRGLAEIASGAGFHDQSHFTRVFRRLTGMTPSVFRRAWRQGSAGAMSVRRVLDPS